MDTRRVVPAVTEVVIELAFQRALDHHFRWVRLF